MEQPNRRTRSGLGLVHSGLSAYICTSSEQQNLLFPLNSNLAYMLINTLKNEVMWHTCGIFRKARDLGINGTVIWNKSGKK